MIKLRYSVQLEYSAASPADFVLNVHPARTAVQQVFSERLEIRPVQPAVVQTDPVTGNRLLRLSTEPGEIEIRYEGEVELTHHLGQPMAIEEVPVARIPADVLRWLYPSRYCPSDQLIAFAGKQFGGLPQGYHRVAAIRQWVENHVKFVSGATTGATSALDTLRDAQGVCRDFAHVMIALCRACNVPARFVSGIDYGAPRIYGPPDFHGYVEAYLGDRWYVFDPTGMCPPTGLMRIGTGQDAADTAFATIFGAVRSGSPRISIEAVHDPVAGYEKPQHGHLAVSTDSGPGRVPTRAVLSSESTVGRALH
jgi:transglutaminase-like putative cysteine protease